MLVYVLSNMNVRLSAFYIFKEAQKYKEILNSKHMSTTYSEITIEKFRLNTSYDSKCILKKKTFIQNLDTINECDQF